MDRPPDGAEQSIHYDEWTDCASQRFLFPRKRHRRLVAMAIVALVLRAILEPGHESAQLLDRFLIYLPALLRRRQLRLAEDAAVAVTARPRDLRCRPRAEQIDPVEGAFLQVEADVAVL